jgi:flagellar protein FlaG
MSSVSASSNAASIVQTTGTVPERQTAPVSGAVSAAVGGPSQQSTKKVDKVEESVKPTREAVEIAAKQIENYVKSMDRDLSFSVDETSGHRVVRVTDPSTGELIRQMPSDETLRIAKTIDFMNHALVSQKA